MSEGSQPLSGIFVHVDDCSDFKVFSFQKELEKSLHGYMKDTRNYESKVCRHPEYVSFYFESACELAFLEAPRDSLCADAFPFFAI